MQITAHDNCKVELFDETERAELAIDDQPVEARSDFNWTKWGTILAGVSILVTIIVAVFV
jgi:hypothetical protein